MTRGQQNQAPARGQSGGRGQQQEPEKAKRNFVNVQGKVTWSAELPLPNGGVVRISASDNLDLLAAMPGLIATQKALVCPKCNNSNIALMTREMSGSNGTFLAWSAVCQTPNCGSQLGLYPLKDNQGHETMLVGQFDEKYREWYIPEQNNQQQNQGGGRGGNTAPSRGGNNQQPARGQGGGRGQAPQRQQQEQDYYDGPDNADDSVPF